MAKRGPLARGNRLPPPYGRRYALVLVNGLAEQPETWFCNHRVWRRYFDVSMPNLFTYDGTVLHQRIEAALPISVDFLVGQLHRYLEEFVQTPPYYLVASSLGGKIAVEYAVRFPDRVASMVLICPSGLSAGEELPGRQIDIDGVIRPLAEALNSHPADALATDSRGRQESCLRLIAEFDSDDFQTRENATRELDTLEENGLAFYRKALEIKLPVVFVLTVHPGPPGCLYLACCHHPNEGQRRGVVTRRPRSRPR